MARTPTSETLASYVYSEIRKSILNGVYQPGERLKPSELRVRYGVSVSVVREALSRLSEQRLVLGQHNQGFHVMELTEKGLQDLTDIRVLNEGFALTRAIERGDFAWESRLLAAHHMLARTPTRSIEDPDHTTEEWSRVHREFHRALVDACDSPLLLEMCDSLFDASEFYRRLSAPLTQGRRDLAREHQELCDAALKRNPVLAVKRLTEHFNRTTTLLIDGIARSAPATNAGPVNEDPASTASSS